MLIYLASPYSHEKSSVRHLRFIAACKAAAKLMERGFEVFCPIAHSHPIEVEGMTKIQSGDFWLRQDFAILKHCDELCVLMLPGWKKSKGIAREIDFALKNNIRVSYMEPHESTNNVSAVHSPEPLRAAQ